MPKVPRARFTLLAPRTAWGLGAAFDARDHGDRDAAVIVSLPGAVAAHELDAFEAAASALEPLRHAAIVPMRAHGTDGGEPFVVYEPADGATLAAWCDEHRGSLRWPGLGEVASIVDGACAAVAVAHRQRVLAGAAVLHGRMDPRCVLLTPAGAGGRWDVAVLDFGLGALRTLRPADALPLHARAPEQLTDAGVVTAASDVFALGALAVDALVPFALPAKPRSWAHRSETSPAETAALLRALRPDLAPALGAELARALALDPAVRHADAGALRTALRRASWEPVAELPPPPRAMPTFAAARTEGSRVLVRLPAALVADVGPAPMNLRSAVEAAPRDPDTDHSAMAPDLGTDPFVESTVPSTSALDALHALRSVLRAEAVAKAAPTPLAPSKPPDDHADYTSDRDLTEEVSEVGDDLFGPELRAAPEQRGGFFAREQTRALDVEAHGFGVAAEGVLAVGVPLRGMVLKAPPRREETTMRHAPPPSSQRSLAPVPHPTPSLSADAPEDPFAPPPRAPTMPPQPRARLPFAPAVAMQPPSPPSPPTPSVVAAPHPAASEARPHARAIFIVALGIALVAFVLGLAAGR